MDVDWERMAVKMAERDGKLKTNKRGEPNLEAAFGNLSAWFIKRLDHQGFGELRDQLITDFPKEETEPTPKVTAGTGHGVMAGAGSCSAGSGSGAVHVDAYRDIRDTAWNPSEVNPPEYHVGGNVLTNDCDAYDPLHVLSAYVFTYPSHGSLYLGSDGGMQYTPYQGYIGVDMFWYDARDQYGVQDRAPVIISVLAPDIDVDSNNDGSIDTDNTPAGTDDKIENDNNRPGKILLLNDDDDNGNGVPDNDASESPFLDIDGNPMADDDLVEVNLEIQFQDTFWNDTFASMFFMQSDVRVWDSATKDNEYYHTSQPPAQPSPPAPPVLETYDNWWLLGYTPPVGEEPDPVPTTLWIEGISPGETLLGLTVGNQQGDINDDVILTVLGRIDLDIDSDNNDGFMQPGGSNWEEQLEDHPYGLGKLIMLDNPTRPVTPVRLTLQAGLNVNDPTITVRFDWNAFGPAGRVRLWDTPVVDANRILTPVQQGGNYVTAGYEYSLNELNYDPSDGVILVYAEGWQENLAIKTLAGVEQNGKPDERIRASVLVNGMDLDFDEVKYLVADEDSFFYFLQTDQGLRAALASRAIYTRADMQAFSMQILDNQELTALGVSQEIADLLDAEAVHGIAGFSAGLYQDFITGEDQYMLAFAGTDDLADWLANIWQGLGRPTAQYHAATEIAFQLAANVEEFDSSNLVVAGHSLGGGLTSAASLASGLHGFSFNASGLHPNSLRQLDNNLDPIPDGMGGYVYYPGSLARYNIASAFIDAYYVDHDILSAVQDTTSLVDAAGFRRILDSPHDLQVVLYIFAIPAAFAEGQTWAAFLSGLGVGAVMVEAHSHPSILYGFLVQENLVGIRVVDALGYGVYFP